MEQDDGFGVWVWSVAEVVAVAVGAEAADHCGARWCIHGVSLGSHRDFAVVADADRGSLAPDMGPPGTGGDGAQDGAFLGAGLLACGLGSDPEFALKFVLVGVGQELVQQAVGPFEFQDAVGQRVLVVGVEHRHGSLHEDGAVVEVLVHKMHGAAGDLHAVVERLVLRFQPREGRQQRGILWQSGGQ